MPFGRDASVDPDVVLTSSLATPALGAPGILAAPLVGKKQTTRLIWQVHLHPSHCVESFDR